MTDESVTLFAVLWLVLICCEKKVLMVRCFVVVDDLL